MEFLAQIYCGTNKKCMKNKINIKEILIIVISVLILGSITYKQFELARAKTRDVDRKASLNDLGQIIRLYYADYGFLPEEKLINSLWGKEWRDGDYVYQKKLPQENTLDKNYCYMVESGGKNFSLLADLENKHDSECQKDKWRCGQKDYCYRYLLSAEIVKP